jgi:hypothetical protein
MKLLSNSVTFLLILASVFGLFFFVCSVFVSVDARNINQNVHFIGGVLTVISES